MELSVPAKKPNLQIEKVRSLQYLTARKVHYYIVNLAYTFEFSSFHYFSSEKLQGKTSTFQTKNLHMSI